MRWFMLSSRNMPYSFAIILIICEIVIAAEDDSEWVGRMFPDHGSSNDVDKYTDLDHHGRVPMGVRDNHCDSGEDPLKIDGDLGPTSYTCLEDKFDFKADPTVHPILRIDHIPKGYVPWHHCMNESISYKKIIPTYGGHRPLWPKYGQYTFLPKQRWLHSLEHGSIVLLYHPCADHNEVATLKRILKRCLYQYVTTASNELDKHRPLALVAWGASLEISMVDSKAAIDFIRKYAYKGPEKEGRDGQYDLNLVEPASPRLKGQDSDLCPND